mgnify:CR=1 FL=1
MTDTNPVQAVATAIDPAVSALIAKAVNESSSKLGAAAAQIVAAALPAMWSMGVAELSALLAQIEANDASGALVTLQQAMTLEQLAAQKQTLATLTQAMAQRQHDSMNLLGSLVLQGLTAAATALVGL